MTVDDKTPFNKQADSLRKAHMRAHPDYKYRPKRKPKVGKQNKCSELLFVYTFLIFS